MITFKPSEQRKASPVRSAPSGPPSEHLQTDSRNEYSGIDELWASERYLRIYNADLVAKMSEAFAAGTRILEFGAGIGTLAQIWAVRTGARPTCLEVDHRLREVLAERGFECHESLASVSQAFDGVYTANVLEHIKDDVLELKRIHAVLKPNGMIAVYVPAFMCLYSGLDRSVGHYRRYSKKELLGKLSQASFEIVDSYFVDSLGFFVSFAVKILGYKDGAKLGRDKNIEIYDRYIYPVSKVLDAIGFRYLFGKNLLVIGRTLPR